MLQILSVPPQKSADNKALTGAGVWIGFFLITTLLLLNVHTCDYLTRVELTFSCYVATKVGLINVTLKFHPHWYVFYFLSAASQDTFSLLKPSTLKQLGRSVPATAGKQVSSCGRSELMQGGVEQWTNGQINTPLNCICLLQDLSTAVDGRQASVADRKVNLLTFLPLKQQHTVSNLVSI